nr:MAK10-like protein [Tanacetum cinerariifolium]
MADLAFAPQHNMVAYLEKTYGRGDSLVRAATTASLDARQDNSNIVKTQSKATLNEPNPQGEGSGSGLGCQETIRGAMAQIRFEGAPIQFSDPPLSTGGHTPGSDEEKEIASLKKRVTKLEQRQSSKILGFHPFRAGTSRRHNLGRMNVSKQGRKNLKLQQKFQDIDDLVDEDTIVEDKGSGEKGGSIAETVSIARPDISAARPEISTFEPKTPLTTTTLFDDEDVIIVDTLVKVKSQEAKEKGVAFKDVDDSTRPIRLIITLQPLPTINPKDKGKGILQEPEPMKKTKKKDQDQIKRDAEVALKIQADLDKEVRIERERQEEASKAALAGLYDEVVPDDDKAINYETLDVNSPIIDYESQKLGTMKAVLGRQDVLDLHKIVMERFPANDSEGYDLILWEDLKTLMEPSEDDEIWRNQQDWKLLSWKLYETCRVHTLMLDDSLVSVNMFVEKRLKKSKVFGYILLMIMKLILKKLDFHHVKIKFRRGLLGFMLFRLSTDLALYDNKSWNDPKDFAKPVKAITFPQDVSSTSDYCLIELKNQVQRLMEADLTPTLPTQVNKITTSCEIYNGPHYTQYCMEDPKQAFVKYAFSRTDEARDTLPSDTVKNPKLSTSLVLSGRSYPTEDLQCSIHVHGSINAVVIHPKEKSDSQDDKTEENKEKEKENPENIHVNPSTPPYPSVLFIIKKVLKLNSFFESLGLVPQSSNIELVCTKGDNGDVMFIEIV